MNKTKLYEISEFLILGTGQNRKLGNLRNCFSQIMSELFSFCLSSFLFCVCKS